MVNLVKELFLIQINYNIASFVNIMTCLFNGLMGITPGTKAIAVLRKLFLKNRR